MDIDIDLPTSFDPKKHFKNITIASMVKNNDLVKHPAGGYFQNIPVDKVTNLAAIPYDQAEQFDYIKFDFLHLSLLDQFKDKNEIRRLVDTEPDWTLLEDPNVVSQLFQVHNHFTIIDQVKPRSVIELADVIALIRPNKRKMLSHYLKDKDGVRPFLYRQQDDDKSSFRKSHSIAYALTIVLQLHAIASKNR